MANFLNRRQFTTKKPQIRVEPGLPAGKHRFQVTAIYADGNSSLPIDVVVNIVKPIIRGTTRPRISGKRVDPLAIGDVAPKVRSTKRRKITKTRKSNHDRRKK